MSQDNVEIVRRVMRCFANAEMDAAFADIDPQATLDWSNSNAPDRGVYVGHDAWRAFMQARDEVLAERRFDSVELLTPADDTVVLIGRVQERGRTSGIEVESRGAAVWTLREGKIVRFAIYQSSADALRAVGLEQTMSRQNVELVRRAFEAYARHGLEAVLPFVAPDAVFYPDPSWMEERHYRGRDGFAAFDRTQKEVFGEDFRVEVREIRAVGTRVLVLTEAIGRATGSGMPIRQPAAHVFSDFRDGMIGEDRTFLSWDAALEELGLPGVGARQGCS